MTNIINKLKELVNKLCPTASDVHVPVPMSREDKINKAISDYNLINSKLGELSSKKSSDASEESVNTDVDNVDVYRGKSF